MASNKDLLNEKKQTMLAELESIKSLLDDELDKIPVLQEAVVERDGELTSAPIPNLVERVIDDNTDAETPARTEARNNKPAAQAQAINTHSPSVLPGQQSLFADKSKRQQKHQAKANTEHQAKTRTNTEQHQFDDNPFLPKHIRQRLNGASALMDDQISALPDAISNANVYTEQLVEQLIARYMPKIESELRRQLFKAMTHQTDEQKQ